MTQDDRMETITDPAAIRASDEPDERGDFPCCTTPAPVGAAVTLDLDAIESDALAALNPSRCRCTVQSGSVYSSQCPRHDPRDPGYRAPWQMPPATALALVAEVRRLVKYRDWWKASSLANAEDVRRLAAICHDWRDRSEAAEAEVRRLTEDIDQCWVPLYHDTKHERDQAEARAESAEAEVVTLRARLAAAHEASDTIERELICCDTYRMDDSPRPGHQICYWSAAAKAVLDAALATTGEGE